MIKIIKITNVRIKSSHMNYKHNLSNVVSLFAHQMSVYNHHKPSWKLCQLFPLVLSLASAFDKTSPLVEPSSACLRTLHTHISSSPLSAFCSRATPFLRAYLAAATNISKIKPVSILNSASRSKRLVCMTFQVE